MIGPKGNPITERDDHAEIHFESNHPPALIDLADLEQVAAHTWNVKLKPRAKAAPACQIATNLRLPVGGPARYTTERLGPLLMDPVPKGYVVHHNNGDAFDFRRANLQVLSRAESLALHRKNGTGEIPPGTGRGSKAWQDQVEQKRAARKAAGHGACGRLPAATRVELCAAAVGSPYAALLKDLIARHPLGPGTEVRLELEWTPWLTHPARADLIGLTQGEDAVATIRLAIGHPMRTVRQGLGTLIHEYGHCLQFVRDGLDAENTPRGELENGADRFALANLDLLEALCDAA